MADEIFDPEIHAVDKDGNPSMNKDGSFRKKRKDAGSAKSAPRPSGTRSTASSGGAARERYRKNVDQLLGIPVALVSMKDPVLGYACGELAPMWSAGLADLAVENPQLAVALERAGNLGAGAALLSAAVVTGVQIGHLLGKVPAHMAKMMGARTRPEIEKLLEQRGVELAAQAEAEARADAEEMAMARAFQAEAEGAREHAAV